MGEGRPPNAGAVGTGAGLFTPLLARDGGCDRCGGFFFAPRNIAAPAGERRGRGGELGRSGPRYSSSGPLVGSPVPAAAEATAFAATVAVATGTAGGDSSKPLSGM